jgi:hypothetical protein
MLSWPDVFVGWCSNEQYETYSPHLELITKDDLDLKSKTSL